MKDLIKAYKEELSDMSQAIIEIQDSIYEIDPSLKTSWLSTAKNCLNFESEYLEKYLLSNDKNI